MPSAAINRLPGAPQLPAGPIRNVGEFLGFDGRLDTNVRNLAWPSPVKAPKFHFEPPRFRNPFARAKPAEVPKPGGIRANPAQAGDDVVRAVNDSRPTEPLSGRPPNRLTTPQLLTRTAIYGGGGIIAYNYGPKAIDRFSNSVGGAVGPEGPAGKAAETAAKTVDILGYEFGGAFSDLLGGLGAGAGTGVYNTLAGVGEGIKKVALPLALVGVGFLAFTALKKK